jgi:phage gp29-like protein
VPPFKVVYHQSTARSGLPQRGGLFRPCAWYYLFKNFDVKDWIIFLEKFGQPLRLGKYQPGASTDDIKVLKDAVKALGVDAGAVIPDTTLLELLEYKGTTASSDLYERFAVFVNKSWQKCVLGQTASSEGTPGKLGAEDAQDQVRQDLLEADAEDLSETLRDQLIWPMVGFNFGWNKRLPHFRFLVERPKNLVELSSTHKTLVEIGVPIPVSYIRKTYAIPEPVGNEPILQPSVPSIGLGGLTPPGTLAFLKKKAHIPIGSRLVQYGE